MTYSLASKLMIVNARISMWEGRKIDRRVTNKTIADNGVTDDDGLRVNKLLVSKDSTKDVLSATNAIRTLVRDHTLPWKDNGDRALMRQMYQPFMFKFADAKAAWDDAVEQFLSVKYPAEIAKASFRLADVFDVDDYPHPEELRSKFRLSLDIDAVAEPDDFRVKLDDGTVAEIQNGMRENIEQRVHVAMQEVWGRVAEMVEHVSARTTPDVQRFHDTTITNLRDLVAMLPGLNLIGDPDLKAMGRRLKDTLCAYDPKDLRKNADVRAQAKAEADAIMEDMKGFMNAFGG